MRYTQEDEVCITTVVVKGPGASLRAAQQHERISQALTARSAVGWARASHGHRLGRDRWRPLYLAASLLFLSLAAVFGYLAFK